MTGYAAAPAPRSVPVVIVGGGVAAAAAAIALAAEGVECAVVAPIRSGMSGHRIGESLGSGGGDLLAGLGLRERFLAGPHRTAGPFFSAWGAPVLLRKPPTRGWTLDRVAFDTMLADAMATATPSRIDGSVRRVLREDADWLVDLGNGAAARGRFLLDCTGRASAIGRRLSTQRRIDRLVACHATLERADPGVEPTAATVLESARGGWWYATLLPSGRGLVAWFTDPCPGPILHDLAAWQAMLAESRFTGPWLASAGFAAPGLPAVTPAGTLYLDRAADAALGWAAAGDAAVAFDPLSSHGIVSALWMGQQAGRAAAAWIRGDARPVAEYADAVSRGTARYLGERRAMYTQERRFADLPFWRSRHADLRP